MGKKQKTHHTNHGVCFAREYQAVSDPWTAAIRPTPWVTNLDRFTITPSHERGWWFAQVFLNGDDAVR